MVTALLAGCGGKAAPTGPATPAPATSAPSSPASASAPAVVGVPHSLVFSATGTATVTSVTYEYDGRRTTEKPASLPWRKVVEVPADGKRHSWRLEMKHGSGRVELFAIFDGSVIGETRGQISGRGTGTAAVSGDVRG